LQIPWQPIRPADCKLDIKRNLDVGDDVFTKGLAVLIGECGRDRMTPRSHTSFEWPDPALWTAEM
jgi:hypothetical protein